MGKGQSRQALASRGVSTTVPNSMTEAMAEAAVDAATDAPAMARTRLAKIFFAIDRIKVHLGQ
jgi:hypothetical protein